jgi:hypothetical protein
MEQEVKNREEVMEQEHVIELLMSDSYGHCLYSDYLASTTG